MACIYNRTWGRVPRVGIAIRSYSDKSIPKIEHSEDILTSPLANSAGNIYIFRISEGDIISKLPVEGQQIKLSCGLTYTARIQHRLHGHNMTSGRPLSDRSVVKETIGVGSRIVTVLIYVSGTPATMTLVQTEISC
jgi:hypothetical protein